jgi:hypothetical protein
VSEQELQQRIRLLHGTGPTRLFRNNVGTGWAGQAERIGHHRTVQVGPGDVVVRNARPLHAGLGVGSSDLIGWRSVVIGPEHVGRTLAVFCALEVKTPRGRATAEQEAFVATVQRMGGIGGVVRSEDEAGGLLTAWDQTPNRLLALASTTG